MPYYSVSKVFFALAMLAACTYNVFAAQPQQRNSGSIEGRVIDAHSFQPVPVAVVQLNDRVVTSQRDGAYRIDSLAPGTYRIRVSATGYETREIRDMMVLSETVTACLVELLPTRENTNICDTCLRAAAFIGKVLDPRGLPVKDAAIDILGNRAATRSGSDGLFSFAAIAEGEYRALVRHPQYHPDTLKSLTLRNGAITNRTITLRPLVSEQELMGELTGRITDGVTAQGIDKATVSLLNTERTVLTNEDGTYRLALVEPGVYSMLVTRWGYDAQVVSGVELQAGTPTQGSISLVPRQAGAFPEDAQWGALEGTVTEMQGGVLANVHIVLTPTGRTAYTDILGSFRFDTLPAGVYYAVASAPGYDSAQSDDIDVWGGEKASLSIVLSAVQADAVAKIRFEPGKGALRGVIVDGAKSEPVSGASVEVDGGRGSRGARGVTDLSGNYVINGLAPGVYSLSVKHAGYANATASGLAVEEGRATQNDFILSSSDVSQMQVMSVRAPRVQNTDASLLKARKQAFTVSDGISAAEISRAGAGNVAAAMKQIPGVTIQDGKYVVIRGLSERYILTTLNGMILPSPDPDKRAVPLDMFPTALIDNIVIYKSFTADLPASFSGGNVDIVTRAIPEKLTFSTSIGGRVDKQVFRGDNTLSYTGGKLDWLGIDDGTRDIPVFLDTLSTSIPHVTQAVRIGRDDEAAAIVDQAAEAFDDDGFVPQRGKKSPDFSGNAMLANRFSLGSHVLGALVSLTYSHSTTSYDNSTNSRYKYAQQISQGEYDALDPVRLYVEDRTSKDILWGGLTALTWELNAHQSVNAIYMRVHNAEDDVRYSISDYLLNLEAGRVAELYSMLYSERDLSMVQVHGSHDLPLNCNLTWRIARATTEQDQPNMRTMMQHRYIEPDENGSYDYKTHENILPVKNPERLFRVLNESSFQTMVDLSFYPFGHEAKRTFLKLGWTTLKREREYRVRRFYYEPVRAGGVTLNSAGGPESYFDRQYLGIIDTTVRRGNEEFVYGLNLYEGDILSVNYDARRRVPAWYAMGNVSPLEWLDVSAGIRHEETFLSLGNFKGDTVSGTYTDWLPNLGLTFTATPEVKIRAMYGKTLAQPAERELAPYGNFDPAENVAFVGNPELEQTIIHNFDLRGEWFQHHADLLAVSVFYKRLIHPIEKLVAGTNGTIRYQNFPNDATALGVEVEGRFSFERLSPGLQGLSVGGNASLIRSRLTISDSEYRLRELYDKDARRTRELQGQSPWVVNTYVVYDNSDVTGYSAAVNIHVLGPTIMAVTQGDAPDAYSVPYPVVSLSAGRKLPRGFSVEGSVSNLFGDRKRVSNTFADKEFVNIDQFKQRAYGLKIGYKF